MKLIPILALAVLCPVAVAQQRTLVVDPAASEVRITLQTTHEVVHGTFHLQSGTISFDPHSPALAGSLVVLAASGDTGNGSRDKRMHNDILEVQRFATVSFAPTSYTGTLVAAGDSTLQVTGTFTLLGTPHPITIPVQVHLEGTAGAATAHFVLPYVQWGVKNPSFLIWKAENDVTIDLKLKGRVSE